MDSGPCKLFGVFYPAFRAAFHVSALPLYLALGIEKQNGRVTANIAAQTLLDLFRISQSGFSSRKVCLQKNNVFLGPILELVFRENFLL